jgi:septal ring factor EnvC (AmiA/AmiB activator)
MEGTPTEPPRTHPPGPGPAPPPAGAPAPGQPPPPGEVPPAAPVTPGAPSPAVADAAADPHERIEGLRGWLAQVDRKINVRTIAIGIVAVLALAAGIVAIVLAMAAEEDAAKQSEIEDVREQLAAVEETASDAAQEDVQTLTERISALEDDLASATQGNRSVEQRISVLEDDIQDLRDQIADLETTTTPDTSPP